MPNLLIENVDLNLLEKQRLALVHLLEFLRIRATQPEDLDAAAEIEGLLNMLDHWSDKTFEHLVIRVKVWFDKANGNSYFSARVWLAEKLVVVLPIQYGYGDHGLDCAIKEFVRSTARPDIPCGQAGWRYCEENNLKLSYDKEEDCLKRHVKSFGEE